MSALILQVNSLDDFTQEIPIGAPPSIVRLNLTEQSRPTQIGMMRKTCSLDLQAVNAQGEIVWLHYSHVINWSSDGPAFTRDQGIYAGMRAMYDLVQAHLQTLGYQVRSGRYGIPNDITPVSGAFECVQWTHNDDDGAGATYTVQPVSVYSADPCSQDTNALLHNQREEQLT